MNAAAFGRGEAITKLENYAQVIVEHLALLAWYPDNPAKTHWEVEVRAFRTTLKRYDKGKKRAHNFAVDDIVETLEEQYLDNDGKDGVLIAIEGHGVQAPREPDWSLVDQAVRSFAESVVK